MEFSLAQQSFQGGRDYNEDRTTICERKDAILLIVADGLGGHAGGEIASQAFVDALSSSFAQATSEQLEDADSFLNLSINYAHHMIHRRAATQGFDPDSPKTTCVVCLIYQGIAQWAHAGDSRLYLIHDQKIIRRTQDHVSPRANLANSPINRCVGGAEPPKPDISDRYEVKEGDIFVLLSDGAWHNFQTEDLDDYVDPQHPTLGVDTLLQNLENRNNVPSDNLSVVVLYCGQKQLDKPANYNAESRVTGNQQNEAGPNSESELSVDNFDMDELESTISEIEGFISELDDKI